MELDELKTAWQNLDRRVDELTRINRALLGDTVSRKARWRLTPVLIGAALNILIGAWFAILWGAFWTGHLDKPAVAIAGIVLHAASVGLIVIGAVRLGMVLRINYSEPVLTIQRSLASLQEFETRSFHAVWFASWVLVPSALVAIVMGFAGIDLWERAPGYILVNFLVCLAGGLAPWLLHRWARRRGGRLAAGFDAFMRNHSIARARAAIDEIEEFARS